MKYLACILLGAALTLGIQWILTSPSDDAAFKAIQHQKDSLAHLLEINAQGLQQVRDSIKISEKKNNALRHLNERNLIVINQWRYRAYEREKQLAAILTYSDAAMDSLYRSRYPQPDTAQANR